MYGSSGPVPVSSATTRDRISRSAISDSGGSPRRIRSWLTSRDLLAQPGADQQLLAAGVAGERGSRRIARSWWSSSSCLDRLDEPGRDPIGDEPDEGRAILDAVSMSVIVPTSRDPRWPAASARSAVDGEIERPLASAAAGRDDAAETPVRPPSTAAASSSTGSPTIGVAPDRFRPGTTRSRRCRTVRADDRDHERRRAVESDRSGSASRWSRTAAARADCGACRWTTTVTAAAPTNGCDAARRRDGRCRRSVTGDAQRGEESATSDRAASADRLGRLAGTRPDARDQPEADVGEAGVALDLGPGSVEHAGDDGRQRRATGMSNQAARSPPAGRPRRRRRRR